MIYFESQVARIAWDEETQCVVGTWKAFANTKDFREALEKGLELVRQQKAAKWLADTRKMGPVSKKDLIWHDQEWTPRLFSAGVRYIATVVPESMPAKWSLDAVSKTQTVAHYKAEVRMFRTLEEARAWLQSQV